MITLKYTPSLSLSPASDNVVFNVGLTVVRIQAGENEIEDSIYKELSENPNFKQVLSEGGYEVVLPKKETSAKTSTKFSAPEPEL